MPDVLDVLQNLPNAFPPDPAGPEVVAGDLARGHRAVTRRRRQRVGFAGAAVAVVAAAALVTGHVVTPATTSPPLASGPSSTAGLVFVAYTGTQPVGFVVDTVPDGWQVTSSDASAFVVAPPGLRPASPGPGIPVSVAGELYVTLRGGSHFPPESPLIKVDVNGRSGQLGHPLHGLGKLSDDWWLIFPDAAGRQVMVAVPGSVHLSQEQIVKFAEGITVTSQVQTVGG